MKIKINRDSVCMADDMDDHLVTYQMNDNSTYEDLFKLLVENHYFPNIAGNNVVWVLTTDSCFCIFSYFTLTNKFSLGLLEKSLYKICYEFSNSNKGEVHLKYYTTPLKWKEKIYLEYQDDEYSMWRDGWVEESNYCDYVMSLVTNEE